MSVPRRRADQDVMKLSVHPAKEEITRSDSMSEFVVCFPGPKDTPFEGGVWKVRVELPDGYPFKSPSIGFMNKIFHPNIDECSGSVCLDVINQTWSAMYELLNIFEIFLPQLLAYPNSADPLNGEAASLHTRSPAAYETKVRDWVKKFASGTVDVNEDLNSAVATTANKKLKQSTDLSDSIHSQHTVASTTSLEDSDAMSSVGVLSDDEEVVGSIEI